MHLQNVFCLFQLWDIVRFFKVQICNILTIHFLLNLLNHMASSSFFLCKDDQPDYIYSFWNREQNPQFSCFWYVSFSWVFIFSFSFLTGSIVIVNFENRNYEAITFISKYIYFKKLQSKQICWHHQNCNQVY